tara:strand:+ start:553 stop:1251 length:699 start_codon:yes stop_codon:yes gene_type:complete
MGTDFEKKLIDTSAKAIWKRKRALKGDKELLSRRLRALWSEHKPLILKAAEKGETSFVIPFRNADGGFETLSPSENDIELALPEDLDDINRFNKLNVTVEPNGYTSRHLIGFNIVVEYREEATISAKKFEDDWNLATNTLSKYLQESGQVILAIDREDIDCDDLLTSLMPEEVFVKNFRGWCKDVGLESPAWNEDIYGSIFDQYNIVRKRDELMWENEMYSGWTLIGICPSL